MSSSDEGSLSAGQIEAQLERLCGTDRPPTEPSSPRTWLPNLDPDAAHVPVGEPEPEQHESQPTTVDQH
eukprot:10460682-Alexandrium_andersonii.AAC.1